MIDQKFCTVKEVAELLKVEPMTIHQLVNRGELKAIRVGETLRFSAAEVEEFIQHASMNTNKKPERKRISLRGIVKDGRVTDADIEEVKKIWTIPTLPLRSPRL